MPPKSDLNQIRHLGGQRTGGDRLGQVAFLERKRRRPFGFGPWKDLRVVFSWGYESKHVIRSLNHIISSMRMKQWNSPSPNLHVFVGGNHETIWIITVYQQST